MIADSWLMIDGNRGYKPKLHYDLVHKPISPNPLAWIWKSCCTLRINYFASMLIMDRLNSK